MGLRINIRLRSDLISKPRFYYEPKKLILFYNMLIYYFFQSERALVT